MAKYICKRILRIIPVLLVVAVISFFVTHLMPGDPVKLLLGDHASKEQILSMRQQLNLDKPLLTQFGMRILDGVMAFPSIIIAIALAGILGTGKINIIIALSVAYFPTMARIVRSSVLSLRDIEYVQSIKVLGASDVYIIIHHIIPNIISPIIVQMTFIFALAVFDEAALSYLGVGIRAPEPSLGGMVSDARKYMSVAPWTILYPGLMIAYIVLGLNLLGDGLRDYFDPKLNEK